MFNFRPKPKAEDPSATPSGSSGEQTRPGVSSPSTDAQAGSSAQDSENAHSTSSEASSSQPQEQPSSSWLVSIAKALGYTPTRQDKNTVYTTGIPGIVEISVTPKEHQRYVIGGYAERNPGMMKPHRCNDRMEDLILATFYATSTDSPWRDFSYTVKMLYRCMRSEPGEEPSEAFKFLDEKAYHRRIKRAMTAYQAEFDRARSAEVGVKEEKQWWSVGGGATSSEGGSSEGPGAGAGAAPEK